MKTVCAWCGNEMGERIPFSSQEITHGICPECARKYFPHVKRKSLAVNFYNRDTREFLTGYTPFGTLAEVKAELQQLQQERGIAVMFTLT